jgi:hypothetical protein
MRKHYFITIGAVFAFCSLQAQITLTQKTHGIVPGNAHEFIFAEGVNEGEAGKNIVWDFSNLKATNTTLTSRMLTSTGAEIPSSNVAIEEFGNIFYFAETNAGILDRGFVSGNSVVKYVKPATKLVFPLTFGSKVTGDFSGVQTNGVQESTIGGSYEVTSDAYGTLLLPNGITVKDALRVKQTRSYITGCACKEIVYRWYTAQLHYPVLVITKYSDGAGNERPVLTAYHPYQPSLEKSKVIEDENSTLSGGVDVFPNPWTDVLKINYTLNSDQTVSVELNDASGRLVKVVQTPLNQTKGSYSLSITDQVPAGIYIVKIQTGTKLASYKIVKK